MDGSVVRIRPHRTRIAAYIGAGVCVVASVILAAALSGPVGKGPELFGPADRMATVGLGLIGALALVTLARPVAVADADGVQVRNIVGNARVPWEWVQEVQFDRRASCAALELHDGEVFAVQAIQVVDKERAVAAVQALRDLHEAHQQRSGSPASGQDPPVLN